MPSITVVISYDLVTPPGMHSDFIKEMKSSNWSFNYGTHILPNTTCYGTYPNSNSATAVQSAEGSLKAVITKMKAINISFKVEKYYIVGFETDSSSVKIFP